MRSTCAAMEETMVKGRNTPVRAHVIDVTTETAV